jgi:hypothetical protein
MSTETNSDELRRQGIHSHLANTLMLNEWNQIISVCSRVIDTCMQYQNLDLNLRTRHAQRNADDEVWNTERLAWRLKSEAVRYVTAKRFDATLPLVLCSSILNIMQRPAQNLHMALMRSDVATRIKLTHEWRNLHAALERVAPVAMACYKLQRLEARSQAHSSRTFAT